MLSERPPTPNVSPTPISLGLKVLFKKTNISALLRKQTITEFSSKSLSEPMSASVQQQVEFDVYPESDYQWLAKVLEALTDIVHRNANNNFATLTKVDYERLDAMLKELIYSVGDDEKHPLVPLMDFIAVLISQYEDEHFPKLTDLFPELTEDVNPKRTKDKDNPTKVPEKPTNALAAKAFFSIGRLFLEGDKEEKAISAYNQAIDLNPKYAHAYYNRGRAKGLLGRYKSAAVDFDESLQLEPDDAYAYLMRGCTKVGLELYEDAIVDFDKSLQLKPHEAYAYFMRGSARVGLGKYQSALTDCDEAIRRNPSLAEAYNTRGEANALLDRTQEAKADFQKALELAKQVGNQDLKSEIEQSLQELDKTE